MHELYDNCSVHIDRCKHFYCRTHKELICRPCYEDKHNDHDVIDLYEEDQNEVRRMLMSLSGSF